MTKRIVILTLTLLLCILPLVSCGTPTAQSLYDKALKMMEEIKTMEAVVTVTTVSSGYTTKNASTAKINENALSVNTNISRWHTKAHEADAVTRTTATAYVDGYFYTAAEDQKIKVACTQEQFEKLLQKSAGESTSEASDLPEFTGADLKDVLVVLDPRDGSYKFELPLTKTQLNPVLASFDLDDLDATYRNMRGTFYFNKEQVLTKIEFEMLVIVNGGMRHLTLTTEYVSFNDDVTISAPEDADQYTEKSYDEILKNLS